MIFFFISERLNENIKLGNLNIECGELAFLKIFVPVIKMIVKIKQLTRDN